MVLKADCIRRLDPWSELGARVGVGGEVGGTAAGGQQEGGGCAGSGAEGQSALTGSACIGSQAGQGLKLTGEGQK